jgi:hypothetical protein
MHTEIVVAQILPKVAALLTMTVDPLAAQERPHI